VVSGADEDLGRAILANLAWGTAREALGHADEFARMYPSELLWREQMPRVLRWAEHVKYSMTLWRRSAWADFSPTTSASSLSGHHSLDGFANLWSG
jgi:hypothetical protein